MEEQVAEFAVWFPALTGLAGVLLGSGLGFLGKLLDEALRRKNRRESYAPLVFQKRLEAHQNLAELIYSGSLMASDLMNAYGMSDEDRHAHVSEHVLAIASFVDRNALYIDEELGAHCTALFMGVEDIAKMSGSEKAERISRYNMMRREALRMIAEDSGISELNKLFKSINKPKLSGPIIERIRELKETDKT